MTAIPAPRRVAFKSYRDVLAASTSRTLRRRHAVSRVMIALTYLAAVLAILPLILIVAHLLKAGASTLNWDFFTKIQGSPDCRWKGLMSGVLTKKFGRK